MIYRSYFKMTIAMLLIGTILVANKIILTEVPVFVAAFIRQFTAFITLSVYFVCMKKKIPKLHEASDRIILFFQSFIGVFLYSIFTLYGLKFTTSLEANLINSITPAGIAAIGVIFLKEHLTFFRLCGITMAITGTIMIYLLTDHSGFAYGASFLGDLLIMLSVIAQGVFFTFGKLLKQQISPYAQSFFMTLLGSIFFLPPSLYQLYGMNMSRISLMSWMLLLYTGIVITALAVVLMYDGMQHVQASRASVFSALTPISGIVLSVIVLHDRFLWPHFIGSILIIIGIGIVLIKDSERKTRSYEISEKMR